MSWLCTFICSLGWQHGAGEKDVWIEFRHKEIPRMLLKGDLHTTANIVLDLVWCFPILELPHRSQVHSRHWMRDHTL